MQSRWMQRRNEVTGENEYFYPITHKDAIVGMEELTANYLPLSGGTLTGTTIGINNGTAMIYGDANNIVLGTEVNTTNKRQLALYNENRQGIKNALYLKDIKNGETDSYLLYGEHNKPTPEDIGAIRNNPISTAVGTGGTDGYVAFAQLKVVSTYADRPITFELSCRTRSTPCYVSIKFVNLNGTDPDIASLRYWGESCGIFAQKVDTSTWLLWYTKYGAWNDVTVTRVQNPGGRIQITYPGTFAETRPTENIFECSGTTAMITGTLPVSQGGTGATSFTSGAVLIGNGTGAITTRGITNNTSGSQSISGNTNLITLNTLRCVVNRDNGVHVADTNYTTSMARGIALTTSTPSLANGTCAFVYA